ncbi:hypothetical protein JKF63_01514 [Porcisia hertigi]|uniref:Uncharacterized protein n=1 Tax=Porcisia hertigi TaxID=2761500 RepID=A0A836KZQ2_9TRYP|nr:hypothetical protein JKF63_01514 [Porcisia hertigi]
MNTKEDCPSFEHTRSGDVFLLNRRCFSMKDPFAIALCCCTKTKSRFDHVGMFLKISDDDLRKYPETRKRITDVSPSGTYILETNLRGVTLYAAEQRLGRTSAGEAASRPLNVRDREGERQLQQAFLDQIEMIYGTPYNNEVYHLLPSAFSPPDKMDRIRAAQKFNRLSHEKAALEEMAKAHSSKAAVYREIAHKYRNAQSYLASTYFPHLSSTLPSGEVIMNWNNRHFWVDGVNNADKMLCSELICNLWHRAGLTIGYLPASSMRPFDFLSNQRFNFVSPTSEFGEITPIKVNSAYARHWKESTRCAAARNRGAEAVQADLTEDQRLKFFNEILVSSGLPPVASLSTAAASTEPLPSRWVVQSNTRSDVIPNLWFRLSSSGILFATCAVPCAPLTLRWMEGQVGLSLSRGSVWSLTCGTFAQCVSLAAAQAVVLAAAARCYRVSGDELVMGAHTGGSLVDTRHPYYDTVALYGFSALVAHLVATPLRNANIAHHFGPMRPGPMSMRQLFKGSVLLLPAALLLPFQAYWLSWYETAGSFVVPTPSSVWRPREDLLTSAEWVENKNYALAGAFGASLFTDALLYPFATLAARRLMSDLYTPQRPPSFGRSLYAGYRFRFLSNLIILTTSTAYLHNLGSI